MPVRSLNSAVLVWPDLASVLSAARAWAAALVKNHAEVRRVLCFGSAAGGSWGVGSDLDVIVEVASSNVPFASRPLTFELPQVPVPVETLVYTTEEIERMRREGRRFIREVDARSAVLCDAGASGKTSGDIHSIG
jgi:predicted nucleotidyltransferase